MASTGMDANARNAAAERNGATVGNLFNNLAWAYLQGQQMSGQNQGHASNGWGGGIPPQQRYGGQTY